MKTIKPFCLALLSLFIITACNVEELQSGQSLLETDNLTLKSSIKKSLPFKASFTVWRAEAPGSQTCDAGSFSETMVMKGNGEMTHLGELQGLFMRFCTAPTPEVFFPVNYSFIETGKFVAANGDELHCVIESGQIWPYTGNNPKYQLHFNDEILFIGGTGRFKGASGWAKTNAYVHPGTTDNEGEDPFYTDFFIEEGELIIVPGSASEK
ncbi:hypothetical protein [Seonamhaeicola aphaedonensis]|uniref:META domain-containing protein n=1 Tax=Seonamhaeicola aphaedonensis TaxID=1461338 RepID=A0A3D9HG14_9FLAO|nr:hypothetical protein [Seonamhaeicola aphaedonensis]RED47926.1 hypothetical protein DFQ02_105153 [Seonamhaeicola aphaedonensis]